MAMVNCPECGKVVSGLAAACPHCGYDVAGHFRRIEERRQAEEAAKQEKAAELAEILERMAYRFAVRVTMISRYKDNPPSCFTTAKIFDSRAAADAEYAKEKNKSWYNQTGSMYFENKIVELLEAPEGKYYARTPEYSTPDIESEYVWKYVMMFSNGLRDIPPELKATDEYRATQRRWKAEDDAAAERRRQKEAADAEAAAAEAERRRQEEEAAERRRQEETERWRQKKRKEAAAKAVRAVIFSILYWFLGIALAVMDVSWLNAEPIQHTLVQEVLAVMNVSWLNDCSWGIGLLVFTIFCGITGAFVGLEYDVSGVGGFGGFIFGAVGALVCGGIGVMMDVDFWGGVILWGPALLALFLCILKLG